MTNTDSILARHTKWRDALVFHLRMADVPGDRIGDILLEVESHLAESGETPDEAFGDARAYAAERAVTENAADDDEEDEGLDVVRQIIVPGLGGVLLAFGALRLGAGDALLGAAMAIAGVAMLVLTFRSVPSDPIRHPGTGQPLIRWHAPRIMWALMVGFWVIAAVVNFFLGRMLA